MSLANAAIDCSAIPLDGEVDAMNAAPYWYDLNATVCGCDAQSGPCQVLSSMLAPPAPLDRVR